MLTKEQHEAAFKAAIGVNTVLAVAGAGKTAVIAWRAARAMEDDRRVAVVTFSNSAALEMADRIAKLTDRRPAFCGTVHGLAALLLTLEGETFGVMDESESDIVADEVLNFLRLRLSKEIVRTILQDPGKATDRDHARFSKEFRYRTVGSGCRTYDQVLEGLRFAGRLGNMFDTLIVDEAQDCSIEEMEAFQRCGVPDRFYCGDPSQAIYRFRGANENAILSAARQSDRVFKLTQTFRFGQRIATVAEKFEDWCDHITPTQNNSVVISAQVEDQEQEIDVIVEFISNTKEDRTIGILCRTNAQADDITRRLISVGSIETERWPNKDLEAAVAAVRHCGIREAISTGVPIEKFAEWLAPTTELQKAATRIITDRMKQCDNLTYGQLSLRLTGIREAPKSRLVVTTMHSAKGMEWDAVILPGWERGRFPLTRCGSIGEEMNLAYVAITRARWDILVTACDKRINPYNFSEDKLEPSEFFHRIAGAEIA